MSRACTPLRASARSLPERYLDRRLSSSYPPDFSPIGHYPRTTRVSQEGETAAPTYGPLEPVPGLGQLRDDRADKGIRRFLSQPQRTRISSNQTLSPTAAPGLGPASLAQRSPRMKLARFLTHPHHGMSCRMSPSG